MNILHRLKKLELNNPNKPPYFCNKTLLDLWYGDTDADGLTSCPNCQDQYDFWANLARDAESELSKNLTDVETI